MTTKLLTMKHFILFLALIVTSTCAAQLPTRLKLKQLEQGIPGQTIIVDSLGNASYGSGGSDGNGIYGGSDSIPVATLATVTESDGSTMDFAIGDFPDWPDLNKNGTETGFYYGIEYWGEIGLLYSDELNLRNTEISLNSTTIEINATSEAQGRGLMVIDDSETSITQFNSDFSAEFKIGILPSGILLSDDTNFCYLFIGSGDPNGTITADSGSIYLRTGGGAGTSFYVKETDGVNTGWVAK